MRVGVLLGGSFGAFVLWLLLSGSAASLSGCAAVAGAGSVAVTGKTPVDHVYSLVTGKNCSLVRKERGLTYCVEDEVDIPVAVHCYPSLGDVTCYDRVAPFPGRQRPVGQMATPSVTSR